MEPPSRTGLQRVGPAAVMPVVLAELGIDPAPVFADLSFGLADLGRRDARISFGDGLIALDRAARLSGRPEVGLLIGLRNDHRCFGIVGELMGFAPTLGAALSDYVGVQGGLSTGGSAYLISMGDCVAFGFGVYDRLAPGFEQAYGIAMGASVNIVRALSDGTARPLEVHFSCRPPADPQIYQRLLKTPVRFNEQQTCVLLDRRALAAANPGADAARRAQAAISLLSVLNLGAQPASQRIRHFLRSAPGLAEAGLDAAARALNLSARVLDRRLQSEGTTFRKERDAVRFGVACELLALTDLSIGDISAALGYANHSAFARGFHRWSGRTAKDWRADGGKPSG